MEEAATSNSSRVLVTGNAACRIRVRALDSSRAVISASTRVRRNSSGFHRWVLAVTSSSGARRRIAASFSRRSPAFRSAASGGGCSCSLRRRHRRRRSRVSGRIGTDGRVSTSACPAARGVGAAPAAARIERTSSARQRRNSHRPFQRGEQGSVAVRGLQGEDLADLPGQAGHPGRGGAGQERRRDLAEGQELLLGRGPGPRRPAWLVRPGRPVVLVGDAGLARRDQRVLGDDLAGERLEDPDRRSRAR